MCVYTECKEGEKKRIYRCALSCVMRCGIYTLWGTRETNKIQFEEVS